MERKDTTRDEELAADAIGGRAGTEDDDAETAEGDGLLGSDANLDTE